MDAFSIWQALLTFLLAFVPWMMPNLSVYEKIIIVLVILLVSCSLYCLRLYRQNKRLTEENNTLSEKHKALARRFDEKRAQIEIFNAYLNSIEHLIITTVQTTKQDRLTVLYDCFLKIKNDLISSGKKGA